MHLVGQKHLQIVYGIILEDFFLGNYLNDLGPPPHVFGIGMVKCEAEQTTPSATWQVTDRPVSWRRFFVPWGPWDCGKARDEVDFF